MKKLLRTISALSAAYAIKNWKGIGKCYAINLEPDDEIEDIMDLLFGISKLVTIMITSNIITRYGKFVRETTYSIYF